MLQTHTAAGGCAGDDDEADEALAEHLREQAAEVRFAWALPLWEERLTCAAYLDCKHLT